MKKGFTLIELLVVVAIISILAVVVVLTLNPAELFRQSRDSGRVSGLGTLNKAISLYYSDALNNPSTLFMGTSSVLYVSIPDPSATSTAGDQCQGLGLPAAPTGYVYHCAASSTYLKVDGTGWIPINFNSYLSGKSGSVISTLPVDPTNQTSTWEYYTYATDGTQYQLYTHMESTKDQGLEANAGGYDPASYEVGTNVNIAPFAGGMIAYWPMNDGSGTTIVDLSGYGYNGTINGATWTTTGCQGHSTACLSFNGSTAYVQATSSIIGVQPLSTCEWIWVSSSGGSFNTVLTNTEFDMDAENPYGKIELNNNPHITVQSPYESLSYNSWQYVCATRDASGLSNLYINGVSQTTASTGVPASSSNPTYIGNDFDSYFDGFIEDVRIWNRVLSPTEITGLFSAGG